MTDKNQPPVPQHAGSTDTSPEMNRRRMLLRRQQDGDAERGYAEGEGLRGATVRGKAAGPPPAAVQR